MTKTLTISNQLTEQTSQRLDLLYAEALDQVRKMGKETWTNHNTHDPGLTILEQLCFALTDLGYRLSFDMADLLAESPDGSATVADQFHTAKEILPTHPLTTRDFRKLVTDCDGVRNAWLAIFPTETPTHFHNESTHEIFTATTSTPLKPGGLHHVLIDRDDNSSLTETQVIAKVKERLDGYRTLGEDIARIEVLPWDTITTKAEIELEEGYDADHLMAQIYYTLETWLRPRPHFRSLATSLAVGKSYEELFTGPILRHGYLDDEEMTRSDRRNELHTSDLIKLLLDIEGVKIIRSLSLNGSQVSEARKWALKLDLMKIPKPRSVDDILTNKEIVLDMRGYTRDLDATRVKAGLDKLYAANPARPTGATFEDLPVPSGNYRNPATHEPVINHLPAAYGVGPDGLPGTADTARRARTKQLLGWLMHFDQLLANRFEQLDNLKNLLSLNQTPGETRTRFHRTLAGASGLDDMRIDAAAAHLQKLATATEDTTQPDSWARKNRMLQHLMARFAEQWPDHTLLEYDNPGTSYITDCQKFLARYDDISTNRSHGGLHWLADDIAGLDIRLAGLLGLDPTAATGVLHDRTEEGFHVVDHILLRPPGNFDKKIVLTKEQKPDPYSYQVSVIFPGWAGRFKEDSFRDLVRDMLIEAAPAHIRIIPHWYTQKEMFKFERAYYLWAKLKVRASAGEDVKPDHAAAYLIHLLPIDDVDKVGIGFDLEIERTFFVFYDM